jgi:hypothetical protein
MQNVEYIKGYQDKILRQYVAAYYLIVIASIGFQTYASNNGISSLSAFFQMLVTDLFVGGLCALVFVFNELWPDRLKSKLTYGNLPSDTVFTKMMDGKLDMAGYDSEKAKSLFGCYANERADKQTSEWNLLLRQSQERGEGNVLGAERLQLLTRDIFMSTISLSILTIVGIVIISIWRQTLIEVISVFAFPLIYLGALIVITRIAAKSRADRFASLVLKNAVQNTMQNEK